MTNKAAPAPRRAWTGSRALDALDLASAGWIKAGVGVPLEHVAIPGEVRQSRIVVDGVSYVHVAEHVDGDWIYRRL